ncbi:MAG: serine hydrolase [Sphingobacteriaceae bacterium]|nr:serine hydrolase [Sphingobacteriaceae bacterium]
MHCKKVLKAKYWCGLNNKQRVRTKNLYEELNTRESDALNTKLAEATMTLLKNDNHILPLKALDTLRIAEVSIGLKEENTFSKSVLNYAPVKHFGVEHDASKKEIDSLFVHLKNFNLILIQVNKSTLRPDKNFGVTNQSLSLIDSISKWKPTIATFFNNPYLLNALKWPSHLRSVIMAYEHSTFTQRAAADAVFGATKFVESNSMGIQKKNIEIIDSIANLGIKEKAYPGCQVVAIKDGKLFFQKSYGTYTYDSASPKITDQTVYDLASITKISSSCLALMKLKSENKFDYKKTLGYYLPEVTGSDKSDLVIEEVLTHQAGLMAWIPFYLKTIDKQGNYKPGIYDSKKSDKYPVMVAKDLYTAKWVADSMFSRILNSKIENKGKYLYSDLGYYFMQRIIEKLSSTPQEKYVEENIYKPMGLGLTYRPLENIN